jgi:cellulose synthase operon protein C
VTQVQKTRTFPMPSVTKTLSPAELAKLEHAFATDPGSEAYKPLAEAYLGMGRFMEAMVVCKKGVKAHPALPDPRVLLARVYAEQGKDKKAIEELTGALTVSATDKVALRMMGALQIKSGDTAPGKENLLKAWSADNADPETLELMEKNGVSVPKPAAPPPPPPAPVVAPPVLAPAGATATSAVQQPVEQPSVVLADGDLPPAPVAKAPTTRTAPPRAAQPRAPVARPPPPPRRSPTGEMSGGELSGEFSQGFENSEASSTGARRPSKRSSSSGQKALFFLLLFVVPVSGAAYWGYGQYKGKLVREANAAIGEATKLVKADTFKGYEEAITKAQFALDLDANADTNRNARGLLAYSYTIRWGEHSHEESNRENAEKNITAGLAAKENSAYLHAAEAMFAFYSGKTADGLTAIEERIKAAEANKKNVSIYYLTRGVLQMDNGDLEAAKESLERAQAIANDDPRVFIALGNLNRRRGNDANALSAFNVALDRTRKTHPEGLLGTANLILDQENPGNGYCLAATYVKALQGMADSAAPRQLAANAFVRALLISRVSRDIPQYTDKAFQKQLEDCTGVKPDAAQATKDVETAEASGLQLDKNNPELFLIRGRRLAYEGKLKESEGQIRDAIKLNSKASHFRVELAKVLMKTPGGEAATETALVEALSLVPRSPKLLSMLGGVQYRQKKMDAARDTLEKAISDTKTRNPEARFLLGKIYRDEKKDLPKAIELLKKAGEEYFADPSMASQAYDEAAITFEAKGDRDGADAHYLKSLTADKDNATAYCHYARFLGKDPKQKDKAKAMASEALRLAPRDACADDMRALGGAVAAPPANGG